MLGGEGGGGGHTRNGYSSLSTVELRWLFLIHLLSCSCCIQTETGALG